MSNSLGPFLGRCAHGDVPEDLEISQAAPSVVASGRIIVNRPEAVKGFH